MDIRLTAMDGHEFGAWLHEAEGTARDGAKGGLVILQEIFGVTDQLKEVAASYAAQGYDVVIPALFDRQRRDLVVPFDQAATGRDLMLGANLDDVMADAAAAVTYLADKGHKVAVMGYCWGGGLAIAAGQRLPLACAVSFYGTRLQNYVSDPLPVPAQGHFGTTDDHTPMDVLERASEAWPSLEMHMYAAGHAFANAHRPSAFDAQANDLAHRRVADFLAKHLG